MFVCSAKVWKISGSKYLKKYFAGDSNGLPTAKFPRKLIFPGSNGFLPTEYHFISGAFHFFGCFPFAGLQKRCLDLVRLHHHRCFHLDYSSRRRCQQHLHPG